MAQPPDPSQGSQLAWPVSGTDPFPDQRGVVARWYDGSAETVLWDWFCGHGKTLPACVLAYRSEPSHARPRRTAHSNMRKRRPTRDADLRARRRRKLASGVPTPDRFATVDVARALRLLPNTGGVPAEVMGPQGPYAIPPPARELAQKLYTKHGCEGTCMLAREHEGTIELVFGPDEWTMRLEKRAERATGQSTVAIEQRRVWPPALRREADETYDSAADRVFRPGTAVPCCKRFPDGDLVVREAMGLGKSHEAIRIIRENPDAKILYLHHRRLLGADVRRRMREVAGEDVGWVLDTYENRPDKPTRLLCQIDSLWKYGMGRGCEWDIVFIDESESVLRQLVTSQKRKHAWATLLDVCADARVICMDAFADALTDYFCGRLGKPFLWRENTHRPYTKTHWTFEYNTARGVELITDYIAAGESVFCPTASKTQGEALERLVRQYHPDLKIVVLHSGTPLPVKTAMLRDINAATLGAALYVMSPCITAGVSIDHTGFDRCVFLLSPQSILADDAVQMWRRVRETREADVLVVCSGFGGIAGAALEGNARPARRETVDETLTSLADPARARVARGPCDGPDYLLRRGEVTVLDSTGLWGLCARVENMYRNRRVDMIWRLERLIDHMGGTYEHRRHRCRDASVAEAYRQCTKDVWQRRVYALACAPALTDVQAAALDRKRRTSRATPADQRALDRHGMTRAFGFFRPCPGWVRKYKDRKSHARRLQLILDIAGSSRQTLDSIADAARAREKPADGMDADHESCKWSDGQIVERAVKALKHLGFTEPPLTSTERLPELRLEAYQEKIGDEIRRCTGVKRDKADGVPTSAREILRMVGLQIANVGPPKTKSYAILGFQTVPRVTFATGEVRKWSARHKERDAPKWVVSDGRVAPVDRCMSSGKGGKLHRCYCSWDRLRAGAVLRVKGEVSRVVGSFLN